jgi:hypothetical protein
MAIPSRVSNEEATPIRFQPLFPDQSMMLLQTIREACGDINAIRMLLKGNNELCLQLFREAVQEGDAILQIQLSHALFGMKWGKDDSKDFSSLVISDLETYVYYPKNFVLFNFTYDQAMGMRFNYTEEETRGLATFRLAAASGYLPAFLELKAQEWGSRKNSYGFAVELRPFVGKGDKHLDCYFGQALRYGCQIGSKLYYEGMYWVHRSGGFSVKYPGEYQSFQGFRNYYSTVIDLSSSYYGHDDFYYFYRDSTVLARSREAWETFVREKLETVRIAPLDSYLIQYDPRQIKSLLNQYKITTDPSSDLVPSSLMIHENYKKIGEISIQENGREICQTIKDPRIEEVIKFAENVMIKTGSSSSAHTWLDQIKNYG